MAIIRAADKYEVRQREPGVGGANNPPTWYGGASFIRVKGGSINRSENRGPSGKRATRYYANSAHHVSNGFR